MPQKSAALFLQAVVKDTALRDNFKVAANPQEFLKIAEELGYSFTSADLKAVVQEYSQEGMLRRQTGVWPWLRSVNWI